MLRNFPCSGCVYFGWQGLDWYCRHPKHSQRITGAGCRKKDWADMFRKKPADPQPVDVPEIGDLLCG